MPAPHEGWDIFSVHLPSGDEFNIAYKDGCFRLRGPDYRAVEVLVLRDHPADNVVTDITVQYDSLDAVHAVTYPQRTIPREVVEGSALLEEAREASVEEVIRIIRFRRSDD